MTLPEPVMRDLLTVVLDGEASPETRRLVEDYARDHPPFAALAPNAGHVGRNPHSDCSRPGNGISEKD